MFRRGQAFSFSHVPTMEINSNYYLNLVKPAQVRLRSPEEDMAIVGKDIAHVTVKVIAKHSKYLGQKTAIFRSSSSSSSSSRDFGGI